MHRGRERHVSPFPGMNLGRSCGVAVETRGTGVDNPAEPVEDRWKTVWNPSEGLRTPQNASERLLAPAERLGGAGFSLGRAA